MAYDLTRHRDASDLVEYFHSRNADAHRADPETFLQNWNAIAFTPLRSDQLVEILRGVSFGHHDRNDFIKGIARNNFFIWENAVLAKGPDFSPSQFALCLRVAGKLSIEPSKKFLAVALMRLVNGIDTLSVPDLIDAMDGLRAMRHPPSDELFGLWQSKLYNAIPTMNEQQVRTVMETMAYLSLSPEKRFVKRLRQRAFDLQDTFYGETAQRIVWASAVLDSMRTENRFQTLAAQLHPLAVKAMNINTPVMNRMKLFYASNWYGLPTSGFDRFIKDPNPLEPGRRLSKAAEMAGFANNPDLTFMAPVHRHCVHAFAKSAERGGAAVRIELETRFSFLSHTDTYRGEERLQFAVLQKNAPQDSMMRFSSHAIGLVEAHLAADAGVDELKRAFEIVENAKPGIYLVKEVGHVLEVTEWSLIRPDVAMA